MSAGYVYSKSRGSIDSSDGQSGGVDFDHFPENFQNRFGYLTNDTRHEIKVFTAYRIPLVETDLGLNYSYRSGIPYNVTQTDPSWGAVFVEPRGSNRTAVLHVLDAQLEKGFNLPFLDRLRVAVVGSVFNVFNSEQPLTYGITVEAAATLKKPVTYQRPRNYQIGFRVEF